MYQMIKISKKYLGLPVFAEKPEEILEIHADGQKLYEFKVSVCEDENTQCDYYCYLNVENHIGREIILEGPCGSAFYKGIIQSDSRQQPEIKRPLIHYTADRGWINDPNGLVYHDGTYHLYYQYNPVNTKWENMSWGHAASSDLLRFQPEETVLFPDEYGTVYSGCGLVNEKGKLGLPKNSLLYYYSAAGDMNKWSEGKLFTQRIAYSTDGGKTLKRYPKEAIGVLEKDSRDPKIFWHEESDSYVMVLWIQENEFAIFRSPDLENWEMSDKFSYDKAWECPDLFCMECDGEEQWVFMSADGFYYLGSFDGYHFVSDGVRHEAYLTKLPYAAQSYSGIEDRTVVIPWLRTLNKGKLYTGMMGIPREAGLMKKNGEIRFTLVPVREYEQQKTEFAEIESKDGNYAIDITSEAVTEIYLEKTGKTPVTVNFFGQELVIAQDSLTFGDEVTKLPEAFEEMHIIIDREVVEIYGNQGTLNAYYETAQSDLTGKIQISGNEFSGKIYQWQP